MSLDLFLHFWFGVNLFIAGMYFGQQFEWAETMAEKIYLVLFTILILFIGVVYLLEVVVRPVVIYKKLNSYFQINFWFKFYLTEYFDNVASERLDELNKFANTKPINTLDGRIYRHCVKLVNKRNNYTYEESTEPQF